jgi:hypothetical protein
LSSELGRGIMAEETEEAVEKLDPVAQKNLWDDLWGDVQKKRGALEGGIRGAVSAERRMQLEKDFQDAHRRWWDSVSNYAP